MRMKHFKNIWKTLETIENTRNMQIKHLQHVCETYTTSR
jgi:hypothetical protein